MYKCNKEHRDLCPFDPGDYECNGKIYLCDSVYVFCDEVGGIKMNSDWKEYRRKGTTTMRPYIPGEDLSGVSVSEQDTPELGGMIARNKDNHADQWYVAKAYHEKNNEEV